MMRMPITTSAMISVHLVLIFYGVVGAMSEYRDCISYNAKLSSMPDLTHRIVYQERRNNDLQIVDVNNTNYQRSFYWCRLDINESDNTIKRYQRFGFNATHWWVGMGCGGWFIVTECRADDRIIVNEVVGLLDKAVMPYVISGPASENKISKSDGYGSTIVDDLYKNWPKIGYRFPNSSKMWNVVDNVTYVDVAQQMFSGKLVDHRQADIDQINNGFYNTYRKARSATFD